MDQEGLVKGVSIPKVYRICKDYFCLIMPEKKFESLLKPPLRDQGVSILAIESSCDETAASVCVDGKILSNYIAKQKIHEQYGGVVPELASRAHMQNIVPVVDAALKDCGLPTCRLSMLLLLHSLPV